MIIDLIAKQTSLEILHLPSVSSISSSVSTKIGYSPDPSCEPDDRTIKPTVFGPKCWRIYEIENLLVQRDQRSIRRLSRFGLYDDDFAKIRGLEKFSSPAEDRLPYAEYWDLSLPQLLEDSPSSIAFKLSRKSRFKFECVPFEEFVRKAVGLDSPVIERFLWQYELLSVILYCKFIRKLEYKGILLQLKK